MAEPAPAIAAVAAASSSPRPSTASVSALDVVTQAGLSLHVTGDKPSDPWGNAFFADKEVVIRFKMSGDPPGLVEITGRVVRHANGPPPPGSTEVLIDRISVTAASVDAAVKPSKVATKLAGKATKPEDVAARDIVELTVSQVKKPENVKLGTIQMTPRPNVIRITEKALPTVPVALASFDPAASTLSGGNLQIVVEGKPAPEPISLGVFFSPGTKPEGVFRYKDDIEIPRQPVRFKVHDRLGLLSLSEGRPEAVLRTDANGLAQQPVKAEQSLRDEVTRVAQERSHDGVVRRVADITAIEGAVVAGAKVEDGVEQLLHDEAGAVVRAFNERDPDIPDTTQLLEGVAEIPTDGFSFESLAGPDGLQRLTNVLQAGPNFSSFPTSEVELPHALVEESFRKGFVVFNIVPIPAAKGLKEIHVAFSDEARRVLAGINSLLPLPAQPGPPLDVQAVFDQAISTTRSVWEPLGVPIVPHTTAADLPRGPPGSLTGIASVLVMSATTGSVDRTRVVTAVPTADQARFKVVLDGALSPGNLADEDKLPGALDTTVKGLSPGAGRLFPVDRDINVLRFIPTGGGQEAIPVGTLLFAEAFAYLQKDRFSYASARELGTFLGNVIAHEAGHHYGLVQSWLLSGTEEQRQQGHTPYRRNRVLYRLFRRSLMLRGPLVFRDVIKESFVVDSIERQYLKEVIRAR